jgi:hypothetical protein
MACALLWAAGCAATRPAEILRIDAAHYQEAFDAALDAARRHGMAPELRDRRGGVIETHPVRAPSWLEPWRGGATWESTAAMERRRARFEFVAADQPDAAATDLSAWQGTIELRVWVVVDRAHSPGVRRDTWAKALTTRATITRPATDPAAPVSDFWEPLHRDPDLEGRLLAEVEKLVKVTNSP